MMTRWSCETCRWLIIWGGGVLCLLGSLLAPAKSAAVEIEPALVVLRDTGITREEHPVLSLHPDAGEITRILTGGFSGRLLRLYRYEQVFLQKMAGSEREPAYLLLSDNRGGFPRFGFFLGEEDKRRAGYVDLHKSEPLSGGFGSMDQIFPHELGHIIAHQLAGYSDAGGANQVHAIGVRTDPYIAFQEGFAEHFQIMALDDPDAEPATSSMAAMGEFRWQALKHLSAYRRELQARFSFAAPMHMAFPLWFSKTEQILRYHAVKENAFAYGSGLPETLLRAIDPYPAYLWSNIMPGSETVGPKSVPVMLSIEGVVAHLFYRWANDPIIQDNFQDDDFYRQFGAVQEEISPLENTYLKIFYVLHTHKTLHTAALIRQYIKAFPGDADALQQVVWATIAGQDLVESPEIWLANMEFQTGTTLFDQFRGLRRPHTFDLNAASLVDLVSIPGMEFEEAERILQGAPYESLGEMMNEHNFSPDLRTRFGSMSEEMDRLRSEGAGDVAALSLKSILMPFLWHALISWGLAGAAAAVLYQTIMREHSRLYRSLLNGFAAAFAGLLLSWLFFMSGGLLALCVPLAAFGIPGALWQLLRNHDRREALRILIAWFAASLPPFILVRPWL